MLRNCTLSRTSCTARLEVCPKKLGLSLCLKLLNKDEDPEISYVFPK